MWALDTSWLVALFDQEDEHHHIAWKEAQQPVPLFLNPIILVEFLEVVRRRRDRATSLQALADLEKTPHVRLATAPKAAAMARILSKHGGISWRDAAAICTALDEGAGLRSFDANQKRAFAALA